MSGARSDVYADLCAWTWDVGVKTPCSSTSASAVGFYA